MIQLTFRKALCEPNYVHEFKERCDRILGVLIAESLGLNTRILNKLANGYGRVHDIQRVAYLWNKITQDLKPDEETYAVMLDAAGKNSSPQFVELIWKHLIENAKNLDLSIQINHYSSAVEAFLDCGELKRAVESISLKLLFRL